MTVWADLTDEELGARLTDLGAALGDGGDVAAVVAARLPGLGGRRRQPVRRWLIAAAVALLAGVLAVLLIAPARDAVARWLGVGAVGLETGRTPDGASPSSTVPASSVDVAALDDALPFSVRLLDPAVAGAPLGAAIDDTAAAPLVEVRYESVSLVEIASDPTGTPVLGKILGGAAVESVDVGGLPGFWVTGDPHVIGFVGPDGSIEEDTVRRAGDVLVWADGDVTYRIEGAPSLARALELAASLR